MNESRRKGSLRCDVCRALFKSCCVWPFAFSVTTTTTIALCSLSHTLIYFQCLSLIPTIPSYQK